VYYLWQCECVGDVYVSRGAQPPRAICCWAEQPQALTDRGLQVGQLAQGLPPKAGWVGGGWRGKEPRCIQLLQGGAQHSRDNISLLSSLWLGHLTAQAPRSGASSAHGVVKTLLSLFSLTRKATQSGSTATNYCSACCFLQHYCVCCSSRILANPMKGQTRMHSGTGINAKGSS